MEYKKDVTSVFKRYVDEMKANFGEKFKVGRLRCNNGGEYINNTIDEYCGKEGIILEPCLPHTSQLNGTAERFNRTMQDKIRALLFDSGYPAAMWEYAAAVAVYSHNRLPSKTIDNKIPYEKFFGKEVSIKNLVRFGALIYMVNNDPKRKKTDEKGVACFMLCYTNTGYKVLDPNTNKVESVKHARVIEGKVYGDHIVKKWRPEDTWLRLEENEVGKEWLEGKSGENIDNKSDTMSQDETLGEMQEVKRKEDEEFDELVEVEVIEESEDEEPKETNHIGQSFQIKAQSYTSLTQVLKSPEGERWKEAVEIERDSILRSGAFKLVDYIPGMKVIDSKWLFCIKDNGSSKKFKARLVIRGFKIRRKYAKFETFAPVAKIQLIRMVLAVAKRYRVKLHQLDIKTAFLNGVLKEEVFMKIPDGFYEDVQDKNGKVVQL